MSETRPSFGRAAKVVSFPFRESGERPRVTFEKRERESHLSESFLMSQREREENEGAFKRRTCSCRQKGARAEERKKESLFVILWSRN